MGHPTMQYQAFIMGKNKKMHTDSTYKERSTGHIIGLTKMFHADANCFKYEEQKMQQY